MQRTVTEEHLVDAMSWTEAEKRITEEMKDFISCEFTITDIRPFKISEAFLGDKSCYLKPAYTSLALMKKWQREENSKQYAYLRRRYQRGERDHRFEMKRR